MPTESLLVDFLLGRPEDGKFCDPTYAYADAFIWGPTQEIVVLFDPETRLVNAVIAFQSYLGSLEGETTLNGRSVRVSVKPRERLQIDGTELTQYASSNERNDHSESYLNEANVTLLYRMVRETFGAEPYPDDFNASSLTYAESFVLHPPKKRWHRTLSFSWRILGLRFV